MQDVPRSGKNISLKRVIADECEDPPALQNGEVQPGVVRPIRMRDSTGQAALSTERVIRLRTVKLNQPRRVYYLVSST